MAQELKVIQDFHGLLLWLIRRIEKFFLSPQTRSTVAAESSECSAIAARGDISRNSTHRRVLFKDIMSYKRQIDKKRLQTLD